MKDKLQLNLSQWFQVLKDKEKQHFLRQEDNMKQDFKEDNKYLEVLVHQVLHKPFKMLHLKNYSDNKDKFKHKPLKH
ncbi:MAG: hypothetical protein EBR82_53035 [Caulobacteraceae bacterium]|nr:hypothetical protein [Caulobacteraceae bacterium]